jgi:hypothetical protein
MTIVREPSLRDASAAGLSGVGWDTLLRQAPMTAETYMAAAIDWLDERYGKGFAIKNPQLIQIYVEACVRDFHSSTISKLVRDVIQLEVTIITGGDEARAAAAEAMDLLEPTPQPPPAAA